MEMTNNARTALVLPGGGARAAYQAGYLMHLRDAARPDHQSFRSSAALLRARSTPRPSLVRLPIFGPPSDLERRLAQHARATSPKRPARHCHLGGSLAVLADARLVHPAQSAFAARQ